MKRKRIELIALLVLVVGVATLALVLGLGSRTARSEGGNSAGPHEPLFKNIKPVVPLKDLPPMPPLFGPKPKGWPERAPEKPVSEMTPEEKALHDKIEWLKSRRFP